MFRDIFNYTLIASTIRLSTPLILTALGGLYSERGGVINIALEGMMLAGAFTAAVVTVFTHSPWMGLIGAVVAGLSVGALHRGYNQLSRRSGRQRRRDKYSVSGRAGLALRGAL
jgi:simple sugar transport system permease protein